MLLPCPVPVHSGAVDLPVVGIQDAHVPTPVVVLVQLKHCPEAGIAHRALEFRLRILREEPIAGAALELEPLAHLPCPDWSALTRWRMAYWWTAPRVDVPGVREKLRIPRKNERVRQEMRAVVVVPAPANTALLELACRKLN